MLTRFAVSRGTLRFWCEVCHVHCRESLVVQHAHEIAPRHLSVLNNFAAFFSMICLCPCPDCRGQLRADTH